MIVMMVMLVMIDNDSNDSDDSDDSNDGNDRYCICHQKVDGLLNSMSTSQENIN